MDPLSLVLSTAAMVCVGGGMAYVAFLRGTERSTLDRQRIQRLARGAGFELDGDLLLTRRLLGVPVHLAAHEDGGWQLTARCDVPVRVQPSSTHRRATGDDAFDVHFRVTGEGADPVVWQWLGAGARGALVRLALRGAVGVTGSEVAWVGEHPPSSAEDLTRIAADLASAVVGMQARSWDEVVDEEEPVVLGRALRALNAVDPDTAVAVARRARARSEGRREVLLDTEVAIALIDTAALLELLPSQPDEGSVLRLAQSLQEDALLEALARAASQRSAMVMAGVSRAAHERRERPAVQRAALAALQTWLAPGALRMEFLEPVAVRLLEVGHEALGPEHIDLLRRMLSVKLERSRWTVLEVVARHGSVALVPDLRKLEEKLAAGDGKVRSRLARTIAHLQSSSGGMSGALSVPREDGGQLAVAPDGRD